MSRELSDLVEDFQVPVRQLINACAERGVMMRPFFTLRPPAEQARLWRSTRATQEVERAIIRLNSRKAGYVAKILHEVGPQSSPPGARGHVTNALPGVSWHQWGEAVDCFWLWEGKAIWSENTTHEISPGVNANGYKVYGEEAQKLGLLSAGYSWGWDWPHVQFRRDNSPLASMEWLDVNREMIKRFGETKVS